MFSGEAEHEKQRLIKCLDKQKQSIYHREDVKKSLKQSFQAIELYKKLIPHLLKPPAKLDDKYVESANFFLELIVELNQKMSNIQKILEIDKETLI